ncbi:hypothetical protein HYALB_00011297 [Hymenoscyphus albidus]|uniref:Uncharacterized protein n=1 Tax=Hymenoscyphus albidus TaxID=595503 RepID=A0A9N9LJP6_9HELO|nr:hypothetical protein HYALB_00011297 [Hymenoscyphus albidus]
MAAPLYDRSNAPDFLDVDQPWYYPNRRGYLFELLLKGGYLPLEHPHADFYHAMNDAFTANVPAYGEQTFQLRYAANFAVFCLFGRYLSHLNLLDLMINVILLEVPPELRNAEAFGWERPEPMPEWRLRQRRNALARARAAAQMSIREEAAAAAAAQSDRHRSVSITDSAT